MQRVGAFVLWKLSGAIIMTMDVGIFAFFCEKEENVKKYLDQIINADDTETRFLANIDCSSLYDISSYTRSKCSMLHIESAFVVTSGHVSKMVVTVFDLPLPKTLALYSIAIRPIAD